MKIRLGFVSNSSSSSFIVIKEGKQCTRPNKGAKIVIGKKGEVHFGWQRETYNDFFSKLNWAVLQASYDDNNLQLIEEVLQERGITIAGNVLEEMDAYIDHESHNNSKLKNKENLKTFLFSEASYIENDNDN